MPLTQPPAEKQKASVGSPEGFATSTFIDRRTCRREVPLKVLALGLSRSGTSLRVKYGSLVRRERKDIELTDEKRNAAMRQALIDLGYEDCYHYAAVMQDNPPDSKMWIEALRAKYLDQGAPFTRHDWDQLLGHCQAITDTPCAAFYRELLEAYPEAKVIYTVRDSPEQWFDSMMRTLIPFLVYLYDRSPSLPSRMYRSMLPRSDFDTLNELLLHNYPMYTHLCDDYNNGTITAIDYYNEHLAEMKRLVPEDRLLVFNVKQGWKPLVQFLGHEEPQYPFPRKNDNEVFQKNIKFVWGIFDKVVAGNALKVALKYASVASAVAVGVAAWRWRVGVSGVVLSMISTK